MNVIIAGAGGHARTVENILSLRGNAILLGIADYGQKTFGEKIGTTLINASLDNPDEWKGLGASHVALAIGDNAKRQDLAQAIQKEGYELLTLIHPTAIIEPSVKIGAGSVICAGVICGAESIIGTGVILNTGAIVDHESQIGDFAHVAPGCRLAGRVEVGERTFIGIGSSVSDQLKIGARTIIGAGSVVVCNIESDVTAYGVPAKVRH